MSEDARGGWHVLLCRVGAARCALRLEHVREMMRALPIRAITAPPAGVLGVAVVRGAALAVLDARALLGQSTESAAPRFVVIRTGAKDAVLAVDEVLGVEVLDESRALALPPLMGLVATTLVERLVSLEQGLFAVLDAARLMPAEPGEVAA